MKITAKKMETLNNNKAFEILANTGFNKKYKADIMLNFLIQIEEQYKVLQGIRGKRALELIEKYGTAEEIEAKKLNDDSPNLEALKSDYAEYLEKEWDILEVEIETTIDKSFFDNGIIWTAFSSYNLPNVINDIFG